MEVESVSMTNEQARLWIEAFLAVNVLGDKGKLALERALVALNPIERGQPIAIDYLRGMIGQPVWLEILDINTLRKRSAGWALLDSCDDETLSFLLAGEDDKLHLHYMAYSRTWLAYFNPLVTADVEKWRAKWIMKSKDKVFTSCCSSCGMAAKDLLDRKPFCQYCGKAMTEEAMLLVQKRMQETR